MSRARKTAARKARRAEWIVVLPMPDFSVLVDEATFALMAEAERRRTSDEEEK